MAYEKEEKAGTDSADNEGDKKILEECQKALKLCVDEESVERGKMQDDLRFRTLDQWPREIRQEREGDVENGPRPCLTIDKINQYRTQIVNDMRQGKPGILVRPQDNEADPETAKILKGLIRNIEDQSSADIAYMTGGGNAVDIGLGYFRITNEYISHDSDEQELFIRPIPNTFSVYLSKHLMPDGSDAKRGYIAEAIPVEQFKEKYPGKKYAATYFSDMDANAMSYWRSTETITVVEEYVLDRIEEEIYTLDDGTTMTKAEYDKWPAQAGPKVGIASRRRAFRNQLRWHKMTGCEVLDKRDLPGKYIPIVEVVGSEAWVEGKRVLWGIVRPAKDSLRMYNYWASLITEKMALSPKTPYIGAKGQFENLEAKWKQANRKNYPFIEYNPIDINGNALPPPKREGATPIEAALLQQMQVIEHDVQTSLGMFKAAVGETESQQSGRAILALQKESDTGTYHFGANLGVSIRHAGRILVDLIPHYYDTRRVVRILGDDGEVQTVTIDPEQETSMAEERTESGIQKIYNPGVGKFDVSITVGPSYNTKRMEAQATFVELARSAKEPALAAIANYLAVRNSDFEGADEAAKMLKSLLPPQALQALSSKGPIPPEVQAMMQKLQQKMQMMQEEGAKLQQENVQLKAGAQVKMAEMQVKQQAESAQMQLEGQVRASEQKLAQEQAQKDADIAIWKARLEAATKITVAQIGADTALKEATLKAETDANIELSQAMTDDPAGGATSSEGNMTLPTPPAPVKPLDKLMQAYQQSSDVQMQSMGELAGVLTTVAGHLQQLVALSQQTVAILQAPKSVSIGNVTKDASGNITGSTVRTIVIGSSGATGTLQ